MKNILRILLVIMTLTSCSNNKIVSIAEEHLKEQLLDKNTYEQISVKVDTLLRSRELIIESKYDSSGGERHNDSYQTYSLMKSLMSVSGFSEMVLNNKSQSDSFFKEQKRKTKLHKEIVGTSKDTIVQFNVKFRFYAVNRLGTRGVYDGIVVVGTDGKPKDVHYYDK
jgi:hypothetical protein